LNYSKLLSDVITLIEEFDDSKSYAKPLNSIGIAVGTLRKDVEIGKDILSLAKSEESKGLSISALARIIIEDFLHLNYLFKEADNRQVLVDNFNSHPFVDHFSNMIAFDEWEGMEVGETKEMLAEIKKGFNDNKGHFLRDRKDPDSENPEDYWRTWTKEGIKSLINKTDAHIQKDKPSLTFLMQNYEQGSNIIHHNASMLWLLATRSTDGSEFVETSVDASALYLLRSLDTALMLISEETKDKTLLSKALAASGKLDKLL
jgi:hypothetical protein